MFNLEYADTFLMDFKKLKSTPYYYRIKKICFNELPSFTSIREIRNLKKIEGYKNFYRIRTGDYRVGISIVGNHIQVLRMLNRKDNYKYFP